jgi:hypothetical protein
VKKDEGKKRKSGKWKKIVIVLVIKTIVTVIVIEIGIKKEKNHLRWIEREEIGTEMGPEKIDHVQEIVNIVGDLILGLGPETDTEGIKKRK